jgi:hypothetical protein
LRRHLETVNQRQRLVRPIAHFTHFETTEHTEGKFLYFFAFAEKHGGDRLETILFAQQPKHGNDLGLALQEGQEVSENLSELRYLTLAKVQLVFQ